MKGYVLDPEVVARNIDRLKTKKQFLLLVISTKLNFHVTSIFYRTTLVVIEDNGNSYVIKNHVNGITDHYLIPVYERENYYIRTWKADTLIIRKRKNYFKFNQLSSIFNVVYSSFF
jgi:hypothetical protein